MILFLILQLLAASLIGGKSSTVSFRKKGLALDIAENDLMSLMQTALSAEVTGAAIRALAQLPKLQACSFGSHHASPAALRAMSSLTKLTSDQEPTPCCKCRGRFSLDLCISQAGRQAKAL